MLDTERIQKGLLERAFRSMDWMVTDLRWRYNEAKGLDDTNTHFSPELAEAIEVCQLFKAKISDSKLEDHRTGATARRVAAADPMKDQERNQNNSIHRKGCL